jgi:hypothetical protein
VTLTALLLTVAGAASLLWGWANLRRAGRRRAAARAGYFDAAAGLLGSVVTRAQPAGFARISGMHAGHSFDLQAVPDTLTFRKLPVLWVMVTLTEPCDVAGAVHVMARPGQTDIFSAFDRMPVSVDLPAEFPQFCALRCSAAGALPDPAVLLSLAPLFGSGRIKEVVISPKGLRLVVMAEEAERGGYLLFRDAEMGLEPFPADRLAPLLQTLVQLKAELNALREKTLG